MNTIYEAIAEAVRRREAVALATIVQTSGSTPRQVGTKMLIRPDGTSMGTVGGGALEAAIIEAAQEALGEGKSRLVHYGLRADKHEKDLGVCGGDLDVFIDVIAPQLILLLVGAGHVAVPLAELAHLLGFRTVVFDDRIEYPFLIGGWHCHSAVWSKYSTDNRRSAPRSDTSATTNCWMKSLAAVWAWYSKPDR